MTGTKGMKLVCGKIEVIATGERRYLASCLFFVCLSFFWLLLFVLDLSPFTPLFVRSHHQESQMWSNSDPVPGQTNANTKKAHRRSHQPKNKKYE